VDPARPRGVLRAVNWKMISPGYRGGIEEGVGREMVAAVEMDELGLADCLARIRWAMRSLRAWQRLPPRTVANKKKASRILSEHWTGDVTAAASARLLCVRRMQCDHRKAEQCPGANRRFLRAGY